jgi:hypothetical protein
MKAETERMLKEEGWTVDCESPLEMSDSCGSRATGAAAELVIAMAEAKRGKLKPTVKVPSVIVFPGEAEAKMLVSAAGAHYGYGNMIQHLKQGWSEMLQQTCGMSKKQADKAAV